LSDGISVDEHAGYPQFLDKPTASLQKSDEARLNESYNHFSNLPRKIGSAVIGRIVPELKSGHGSLCERSFPQAFTAGGKTEMADTGIISPSQRDLLIKHIDGSAVILGKDDLQIRRNAINGLIRRGFLQTKKINKWRYETTITDKGRAKLAEALGEYADALIRAKLAGAFGHARFTEFTGILEQFSGLGGESPVAIPDK
jgi:hypothetical protein